MQARALTAVHGAGERLLVVTSAGPMTGLWRGDRAVKVDEELHIELELERPRDWSEIRWVRLEIDAECGSAGTRWLEGVVTDIDQDGVLTLDVVGSPLMIDTTGEPPLGVVGMTVRLAANDLEFFAMDA